jgi:hypothetical protein
MAQILDGGEACKLLEVRCSPATDSLQAFCELAHFLKGEH